MNQMSGRIRQMIAEESARAEDAAPRSLHRSAHLSIQPPRLRAPAADADPVRRATSTRAPGARRDPEFRRVQRGGRLPARRRSDRQGWLARSSPPARAARSFARGWAAPALDSPRVNIEVDALRDLVGAVCAGIGRILDEQGAGTNLHYHCGATRLVGALPEFSALLASADHAVERAQPERKQRVRNRTFRSIVGRRVAGLEVADRALR